MSNRDLFAAAARINALHRKVLEGLRTVVEDGIAAGNELIEAKAGVKHGEWVPWLEVNVESCVRSCQYYMTLARNADLLKNAGACVSTIEGAIKFLGGALDMDEDEVEPDVLAACVQEEEEDELAEEERREEGEAVQDSTAKLTRKLATLKNLISYFRAVGRERLANHIAAALREEESQVEAPAAA